MVTVEIRGKQFPLCLTVAALDQINAKCGGLGQIGKFMDGQEPNYILPPEGAEPGTEPQLQLGKMAFNTAWLLALLLREGEENRLVLARLDGEPAERREVPDADAITHLLTVSAALNYRVAVYQAINESMHQDIEASHEKNVKSAEQG